MGIFDFESMFAEAYDNIEEKGVSVYYADMYDVNENIVCIQTPDGTIYDKNNYILEDQLRYQHMIDMSALKVVRSEVYESVNYEANPWGIIETTSIGEDKVYESVNYEANPWGIIETTSIGEDKVYKKLKKDD